MKHIYKKTKKGHTRRNATTNKRRKRTRRQRGGAYIENVEVPHEFARDKHEYNIIETDTYNNDSLKYVFHGKAKAIVIHQSCGIESICAPRVSYRVIDGPGSLTVYEPNGTIHSIYNGDFVDGKKHGHGKTTFNAHPVFQEYDGNFEEGIMQGNGRIVMKNGDVYTGEFQDDLMHGEGTMTFHDGTRYEGDWNQGQMNGNGKLFDDNGAIVYEGRILNGEPLDIPEMYNSESEDDLP